MRVVIFVSLIAGGFVILSASSAEARGRAFCMRGPTSAAPNNCSFDSMAQCRASASGRNGMSCIANPFYRRPAR
jgi:hypothetical protein